MTEIFFDESGDLGWQLGENFRRGGSSKYFVISFLIIPQEKGKFIERFVRKFHEKRGSYKEYKGASFRKGRAATTAKRIEALLRRNTDIKLASIVFTKESAPLMVREKGNEDVLYNFLVREGLLHFLRESLEVKIIPDQRSVPSGSQNSCSDLLKTALWFDEQKEVRLNYAPEESHNNLKLQFIDWIANFTWRAYENKDDEAFRILKPLIQLSVLD